MQRAEIFRATILETGSDSLAYLLKASSRGHRHGFACSELQKAHHLCRIRDCRAVLGGTAQASQGPGTSAGTAGHFTQLTMAVLVYGIPALVIGAGLIGALRRR